MKITLPAGTDVLSWLDEPEPDHDDLTNPLLTAFRISTVSALIGPGVMEAALEAAWENTKNQDVDRRVRIVTPRPNDTVAIRGVWRGLRDEDGRVHAAVQDEDGTLLLVPVATAYAIAVRIGREHD
ncbi:hypothetical protein [Cellulosimicrobium composti]|uniref:hypothetical protein n=1 Tax=Cellulosimicrobium composti TaxID=2672572 RepID=UPI0037BD4F38